jgi:hypothetical protein
MMNESSTGRGVGHHGCNGGHRRAEGQSSVRRQLGAGGEKGSNLLRYGGEKGQKQRRDATRDTSQRSRSHLSQSKPCTASDSIAGSRSRFFHGMK